MLPPLVLRRGMLMTIWSWMLVVFATPIILPYDRPLFPTHSARKSPYTMRQVSRNETVHLGEQAPLYIMEKSLRADDITVVSLLCMLLASMLGFRAKQLRFNNFFAMDFIPHRCNPLYAGSCLRHRRGHC